jgi:hypothetical protein
MMVFKGYELDDSGRVSQTELPDVATGFTLTLDTINWEFHRELIQRVFSTVSPMFQPYLPPLPTIPNPEYAKTLSRIFDKHGLGQISVEIDQHQNNGNTEESSVPDVTD